MDISTGWLITSLVVSTVGFSLFVYGKKQTRFPQLVTGLVLLIYPNFITSPGWIMGVAAVCCAALWLMVRAGY